MNTGFIITEVQCNASRKPSDLKILAVNPALEKIFNIQARELVSKMLLAVIPDLEYEIIDQIGTVALTTTPVTFETYIASLDKYLEITAFSPIAGQCACLVVDSTERRNTDEALQKTQKLEALALLAGGIAHDFNNLLGGIYGCIDLAQTECTDSDASENINMALTTLDRARALTSQLITFAKGGIPLFATTQIGDFIVEAVKFALSGSNVTPKFTLSEDLRLVRFDKNQIGQVIDNITINAIQAMPLGGIVHISVINCHLSSIDQPPLPAGEYVKISIKDSGIGIPSQLLPRIFDPFFTTKEKGHGLGLATSYTIFKKHGGCIDVKSKQGRGTTFHLYLPAAAPDSLVVSSQEMHHHRGTGLFIVVDDDAVMRTAVAGMLKSFGYNVARAAQCKELTQLLDKCTAGKNKVAGFLVDLTIPGGCGGIDALPIIKARFPDVPVFVMSGYVEDDTMKNPGVYLFNGSICKPFVTSELAQFLNTHLRNADD